jgi:hypothetical protein
MRFHFLLAMIMAATACLMFDKSGGVNDSVTRSNDKRWVDGVSHPNNPKSVWPPFADG